jgi:choline dehydrogenase-like flavoprotein
MMNRKKTAHMPFCQPDIPSSYLDSWLPFKDPEKMAQKEYDVLIVGTGGGGAAALWRLCDQWGGNGKEIAVIEAGDQLLPTHVFNIPTFNVSDVSNIWQNPKYLQRIQQAYPTSGSSPTPVDFRIAKVLGGRFLHWGTACPRMDKADISQWPVSLQEINKYYNIAEKVMNVTPFLTQGSSLQEIMLQRLRENGFHSATNLPRTLNHQPTIYGQIQSSAFFSSLDFLAMALIRKPFDLAVKTRAIRVVVEKGRVVGVEVISPDKKSYVIKAKTVVLSASTMETPRILLYSGIRGEAVGHYLACHSRVDASGLISRTEFPEVLGNLDILVPRTEIQPFQLQIERLKFYQYKVKPVIEELEISFFPGGVVESRFKNRVTLDPVKKDEYGIPLLRVYFSYSEKDYEVINQTAQGVKRAAAAMGITLTEKIDMHALCLRAAGGENHDMGTCRMGMDPATSATNQFGQIHGVPGLYVADASVIPTTGAANPGLTIVALAIRTADYIVQQNR